MLCCSFALSRLYPMPWLSVNQRIECSFLPLESTFSILIFMQPLTHLASVYILKPSYNDRYKLRSRRPIVTSHVCVQSTERVHSDSLDVIICHNLSWPTVVYIWRVALALNRKSGVVPSSRKCHHCSFALGCTLPISKAFCKPANWVRPILV